MIRTQWLAIGLILGVGSLALAEAPKLSRSSPANGAKNVPTDVGIVRLVFDQPMKMNQWTLWQAEQGIFPPKSEDSEDPWLDPQTFELKVKTLKPNTTYCIQLNSEKRQGFRSAEGNEPMAITAIVFTTGGGPKGAVKSVDPKPVANPLDGPKSVANPLDGPKPVANPLDGPKPVANPLDGPKPVTNPLDGPKPVANPLDGPKPVANPLDGPKPPSKDSSKDPDCKPTDPVKPVDAPKSSDVTAEKLCGTWLMRNAQIEVTIVFTADGNCTRTVRTAEGTQTLKTTYTLKGGKITMKPTEGGGEVIEGRVKLIDAKTLELTDDEGNGVRVVKQ